ncbi:MAG: hypothetical protein PWP76_458 [Candidatus Diapherotrites archaeon]|nr:hypothetical protein [Candidatus Diapherotrites archaeon]MDN5366649.1 hypothetical protein [Candidatus Diapherotrites archaeon]
MRVLMIGWEFPPFFSGGLGVHAYYLTKHLAPKGVELLYVMPYKGVKVSAPWLEILQVPVEGDIGPYLQVLGDGSFKTAFGEDKYPADPVEGAKKYAKNVVRAVLEYIKITGKKFDLIHAHDWITFLAGIQLKEVLGIPLVVTFHSTEYSRTADRPYDKILEIEKAAINAADRIIAVSNKFKQELVERLGADPEKIDVVFNAIDTEPFERVKLSDIKKNHPIVLFFGRLTFQKGPEFFLQAAKLVSEVMPEVRFIVAGKGFLLPSLIQQAAQMGIADKVIFLGYVPEEKKALLYRYADVYVMPSVYEPFGITALEAMAAGTPVIVSKNAGVTDLVKHVLTVDFWDTHELANKIISVLRHRPLRKVLAKNGYMEIKRYTWDSAAELTLRTYKRVLK